MNLLDQPVPFAEAVNHLLSKEALPTDVGSQEIRQLSGEVKRQAMLSAHTLDEHYLDTIQAGVESILNPKTEQRADRVTESNPQGKVTTGETPGTLRTALRAYLKAAGYSANPDEAGGIKDLASDLRLNLVVKTNVQLAQGAGQFVQGNSSQAVVNAFPGWELVRYEDREVPRGERRGPKGTIIADPGQDWPSRFEAACLAAGDDDALAAFNASDRMVALKSSGVWQALGDGAGGYDDTLGNPYPPFAFNSGMWTEEISYRDCVGLGLLDQGEAVEPADFDLSSLFQEAA